MSPTTPVPVVAVVTAPAAQPPASLSNVVDSETAQALKDYAKDPESLPSQKLVALATGAGVESLQQMVTQLTTIAAAFKPPAPAQTPAEGLAYVGAQLTNALQEPFGYLQQQNTAFGERLGALETLHGQLASQVETQSKQVDANVSTISRDLAAVREAVKELRDMQRAQEQKLVNLERLHRNTVHHLQALQTGLARTIRHVEGWDEKLWEELDKALNRHSEIVFVEKDTHDDGRRRR